eukprot:360459-Chlamydomonas_euryale.AAC.6
MGGRGAGSHRRVWGRVSWAGVRQGLMGGPWAGDGQKLSAAGKETIAPPKRNIVRQSERVGGRDESWGVWQYQARERERKSERDALHVDHAKLVPSA